MPHFVDTAFPDGEWTPLGVRQAVAAGVPLMLEDPDDLQSIDLTGLGVLEVRFDAQAFVYDPTDMSSAHDGVTTLVSQDGKRFKAGLSVLPSWAVLGRQAAPPGSPAVGDRYLVGTAPSGDWASNADDLTIYTSRGWEFASPTPGQVIYIRDEDLFAHWAESAAWLDGMGAASLPNGSVEAKKLEWPMGLAAEEETDTPPGGTPAASTLYIVAASATGDWSGEDTKVARANGAGGWTFLAPYDGARVFDRAAGALKVYRDATGEWEVAAGAYVGRGRAAADTTAAISGINGTSYPWSPTTAPTTSNTRWLEPLTLDYTAEDGAELEISYDAGMENNGSVSIVTAVGLFIDDEVTARDWRPIGLSDANYLIYRQFLFHMMAPDAAPHTYKILFFRNDTNGATVTHTVTRRRMIVREVG